MVTAGEIMRPYRIEVDPQWSIVDAIDLMRRLRYYHLIIVDPHVGTKWPVGILSSSDVVRCMSGLTTGQYEQMLKIRRETV
jgi:predicted transcriptional regulator